MRFRKTQLVADYIKGKLFTFDAPTNAAPLTGLSLDLQSSRDILFELPEAEK